MTAKITIVPPIKATKGGFSCKKIQAHIGPRTASVSIIIPTKADVVVLAPIVIKINPNPTWKKPAINARKIS